MTAVEEWQGLRLPFVGRQEELGAGIRAVLAAPSVLCVTGPAGVGKTRLVREILADRQVRSRTVLRGTCQPPPGEAFPCGAVFEALRLAGPPPLTPSAVTGALAPYLPEIAAHLPPALPPLPDRAAEWHRLFRAVRDLLDALSPVVLVVEDLQWADDRTRALVRYLAVQPPERLSIVLTQRPGPVGFPGARVISLSGLDSTAVAELALTIAPTLTEQALSELPEHTGGRPDLVEHAAAYLLRTGEQSLAQAPLPREMRLDTAACLDALSPTARAVVLAAAVLDAPAPCGVLARVAGTTSGEAATAIAEAVRACLLSESGAARYRVEPGAMRRCVYDGLPGPDRRRAHARALSALRDDPGARPTRLARHARLAGRFAEWIAYTESADGDDAAAALGAVLDEPGLPSDLRERVATRYARLVAAHPEHGSDARLDDLVRDPVLSTAARAEARLALGMVLVRRRDGIEAGRTELALAVGELADRPARAARAMAVLADPALGARPLADHREWLQRGVRTAGSDRPALLAAITANRVLMEDGPIPEAVRRPPEGVRDPEERLDLARAHLTVAHSYSWTGQAARARAHLRTARRLSDDTAGTGLRLRLDLHTGQWAGLAERAEAHLSADPDALPDSAEAALVLAVLASATGDRQAAERWFARTGLDLPEDAVSPVALAASAGVIRMLLDRDEVAAAVVEADRAMELFGHKGIWAWSGEVVPAVVRAWLRAGGQAEARTLAEETTAAAAGSDAPAVLAAAHASMGAVAAAEEAHERALWHFERARHHAARTGAAYAAAAHGENAVRTRLKLGDAEAVTALITLVGAYENLGATRDANRCRLLLRDHGSAAHTRRWRRNGPDALSPREQDVAALLVRHRSNQEIADTLFLSRRTVEQHVASVLRKLGVKSRHDVTGSV
ncbi:AAA family ATPase [Actinokineospora xionganensis]|uniref:AAA family ATPase n=1 Tax=Actinokineospora xionganensis TaxID=2684470 RepID=A0ABR7LEQ1_9PSEU|nr:AAA family ATPase [Actinokineospora xionganensis]MBC6451047.1 AAA family ATPase [Actinokineospora xionganensis]